MINDPQAPLHLPHTLQEITFNIEGTTFDWVSSFTHEARWPALQVVTVNDFDSGECYSGRAVSILKQLHTLLLLRSVVLYGYKKSFVITQQVLATVRVWFWTNCSITRNTRHELSRDRSVDVRSIRNKVRVMANFSSVAKVRHIYGRTCL